MTNGENRIMSFDRKTTRNARHFLRKLQSGSQKRRDEDGKVVPVFGSSQAEAIAHLRVMDIPPAPPGSADMGERDHTDPVEYRRRKNAAKRQRRAR